MNEKIKKLRNSAVFAVDGDCGDLDIPDNFAEKFAELLIKECLVHCEAFEVEVNRSTLVDRIKHHFGVK